MSEFLSNTLPAPATTGASNGPAAGQEAAGGPEDDPPVSGAKAIFRLLRYLGGYTGKFFGAAVAIQIGNWLQLLFAVVAGCLVDGTLGPAAVAPGSGIWGERLGSWLKLDDINRIGLALGGMALVVVGCRYVELSWFGELGERAIARLRRDVFARLVRLPLVWHTRRRVGELASRVMTDLAQVQEHWVNDLRQFQTHGTIVVGSVILMCFTSLKLTAVLAVVAPITVVGAVLIGRQLRHGATQTQARLGEAAVILEETLQGIQHVKVNAAEAWEIARYEASLETALVPAVRAGRQRALFICAVAFLLFGAWVFLMWQGSRLVEVRPGHERELSPGDFTSFMFLVAFTMSSAGVLAEVASRIPKAMAAAGRVFAVLDQPEEEDAAATAEPLPPLRGEVMLAKVDFTYPTRPDLPVLHDITLTVQAGEKIALVGPSGAGKSTLAALLGRLFDPTSGTLLIDSRPARDYPLRWLRGQMAYVPQEILLFGGTIAENIAYGRPDITRDDIRAAAAKARALEFIEALPLGFESPVGDRGSRLSGGQRQRLALARAILRNPAILILDEATSALDSQNERLIQEALEEVMAGRTTFIIAHRLSTVRQVDRIVVLDGGRLVESGTHAELYARGGVYRDLCDHQYFETGPEAAASAGETTP